jgi:cytochrome c oxidase cbb3-type subunit I/II
MIRPFRSETERYGEYSKAGEFVYDHPFLWGSKRTGPDLQREGRKYPNQWHFMHMEDPRTVSPGSIMPQYTWLFTQDIDMGVVEAKIRVMQKLGVPYPKGYDKLAAADLRSQAELIAADLQKQNVPADPTKEIIALIAYLQRLGTDIQVQPQ